MINNIRHVCCNAGLRDNDYNASINVAGFCVVGEQKTDTNTGRQKLVAYRVSINAPLRGKTPKQLLYR